MPTVCSYLAKISETTVFATFYEERDGGYIETRANFEYSDSDNFYLLPDFLINSEAGGP
jgi:hypothetical protein